MSFSYDKMTLSRTDGEVVRLLSITALGDQPSPPSTDAESTLSNDPPSISHSEPKPSQSEVPQVASKRRWLPLLLDAAIIAAFSAILISANLARAEYIFRPPNENDTYHLFFQAALACSLDNSNSWWEALTLPWIWPGLYPAGSYSFTYLFCRIFGSGIVPAVTSIVALIPLLLAAVYFIIRPCNGFWAALACLFAATSIPTGWLCSSHYPSDFQVGLGVCLTLCALFFSDGLRKRKCTLIFGLVLGYSLLFKSNVAWFIAPALAVVIISRRSDWRTFPWSVAWHISLFVSAFIVCIVPFRQTGLIQLEMARYGYYLTPSTIKMIALVTAVCLLWWWLAQLEWKKVHRVPALVNLSQAMAITFFVSMPWILVNTPIVNWHVDLLSRLFVDNYHLGSLLAICKSIYFNSFGPYVAIFLALSWILACTKWANTQERALAASSIIGFMVTAGCLGGDARYYFPCYLVSACCLAAPLRRSKWLAILAILAGFLSSYSAIIVPAFPSFAQRVRYHGVHIDITQSVDDAGNYIEDANSSVYGRIWQACPALSDSKQPRWIALRKTSSPLPHLERAYFAIATWSAYNHGQLVPFYFTQDESAFVAHQYYYLDVISANRLRYPAFAEQIHSYISSKDATEAMANTCDLLHCCAHIVDISTADHSPLTIESVARIMECPSPVHQTLELKDCAIHIWSRAEASPQYDELSKPDHALILKR